MRQPMRTIRLMYACGLALCALLAPSTASAENLWIKELNERVAKWKTAKKEPPPVIYVVEGRAVPLGKNRLRFKQSPVPFESANEIAPLTHRNSNVQVTGQVIRAAQNGEYSFRIERVVESPSDLEQYLDQRRELRSAPPEKWYALANWARERGEFYKDDELLARSDEAFRHGFDRERKELAREHPEALYALAERARRLRLPRAIAEEVTHEAVILEWQASRKETGASLAELEKKITSLLPGATEDQHFLPPDLQKQYFIAPGAIHASADAATRRKLHRMLYTDVVLRMISPELAVDGSNGFAIAKKIEDLLPEQGRLAETYRDKALAAQANEVESLSRSEMVALSNQYRQRQQPVEAARLIESWLTLKRRQLEPDDTEGLLQLTDDYRSLLKRNDLADRLLMEAWQQNPKAADIGERLQSSGYRLRNGVWMTEAAFNARPDSKIELAIQAGRVEPGMTASQVRRSLGEPQALARAATAGQISEVWTYAQGSATRLVVRLRRNRREADLHVIDISQASAR